jgi:legumain
VLLAGSNEWYNYRHQADVCHAYQILLKNGVPAEQIITFMYDDIAHNPSNPTPGVIINKPGGSDVYKGVQIDYRGKDVTVANFLNALTGVSANGKKVLKSGPDDHVFINMVDHGAPGIFAFPSEELTSKQLIAAINTMAQKRMYGQLVAYVEACESGSMFEGLLPRNASVFATTASSPDEPSYACYYDAKRDTYLGDLYSVNWMEDSDKEDLSKETLQTQFSITKKLTNMSTVEEYGKMDIAQEPVGDFQGDTMIETDYVPTPYVPVSDAVRSDEVQLTLLRRRLGNAIAAEDNDKATAIESEIAALLHDRAAVDAVYTRILNTLTGSISAAHRIMQDVNAFNRAIMWDCYEPVLAALKRSCFPQLGNTYAARRLYTMVTVCRFGYSADEISHAIDAVCKLAPPDNGIVRKFQRGTL